MAKTTTEAAGANCATGGLKVEYGLDANSNGTLDAAEINTSLTKYVCNGAQGPQGLIGATGATGPQGPIGLTGATGATGATGPAGTNGTNGKNTLAKTTTEAAGANCATGGVKVEYGLDANSNGTLDAAEIDASLTKYICNGAIGATGATGPQGPIGLTGATGPQGPIGLTGATGATGATGPQGPAGTNGKNTIVKTTNEAAGTNCPGGGVKLEYGLDANSNGTLDAAEINASLTKYVCNGDPGQHPVYIQSSMAGGPFTINVGFGATVMVRFHTQCSNTAIGGLIFIQSNGNISVLSSGGSGGGTMTASGNVLSLNNLCISPWTYTFTVSGNNVIVTPGGGVVITWKVSGWFWVTDKNVRHELKERGNYSPLFLFVVLLDLQIGYKNLAFY